MTRFKKHNPLKILIGVLIFSLGFFLTAYAEKSVVTLEQNTLSPKQQKENKELTEISTQFQNYLEETVSLTEDKVLQGYLTQLAQEFLGRLGVANDANVTVRIVRDPTINAFALATGHIYFHSGLLARVHNESQLAFVLAHEISHIYHRDNLYQFINSKRKKMGYKITSLLLTAPSAFVGASGLSDVTLAFVFGAAMQGYGRAQEAYADQFAMDQVVTAGYDPAECLKFFDVLLAEEEKYEKGIEIYFLSSHPSNKGRKKDALQWLQQHPEASSKNSKETGEEEFIRRTLTMRLENVELNINFHRYFHALEILDQLAAVYPEHPQIDYYYGEVYRRLPASREKIREELSRKEWKKIDKKDKKEQSGEWREKSRNAYQKAIEKGTPFAPAYRGLGEWFYEGQKMQDAKKYFEEYLKLDPNAKDRRSVTRYLRDIEEIPVQGVTV